MTLTEYVAQLGIAGLIFMDKLYRDDDETKSTPFNSVKKRVLEDMNIIAHDPERKFKWDELNTDDASYVVMAYVGRQLSVLCDA